MALADLLSPIAISNYSPVVAVHGLPYVGDAQVLSPGSVNTRLMYDVSSHYAENASGNEFLLLDGETYRTTLVYRQGITAGFDLTLVVPYLKHTAGGLDSFINKWHESFGLPKGGRDLVPNNQFHYTYFRGGRYRFDRVNGSAGIGDLRMQGNWQLRRDSGQASALALSVKFPTGDSQRLLGSGATDVALWYKRQARQHYFGYRGGHFYSLGLLYLGQGDVLGDLARPLVGFGGIGAGVYLSDKLVFISQLDINSPVYAASDLKELNGYAVQLTLGGNIILSNKARINLGVAEDLVIDVSPDVTFHLELQWQF